ncbi:MAG: DUF5615 family PIN-like protein [Chloroflexota bacterium]
MRVIVDECTGVVVARWLESLGHDVLSVREVLPRMPDADILALAVRTDRIVITNDKDFGDMVFRDGLMHRGIILLRLADDRARTKLLALERFFADQPDDLAACFVVVTEDAIRVSRSGS